MSKLSKPNAGLEEARPFAGMSQVCKHLKRICGVDITAVQGVSASLAQTIVIEVGTDMSKFPNEKHFCSWLGLAPKNEISGGKVLKNNTLKTNSRAGQAFRMAAGPVMRADCALGLSTAGRKPDLDLHKQQWRQPT